MEETTNQLKSINLQVSLFELTNYHSLTKKVPTALSLSFYWLLYNNGEPDLELVSAIDFDISNEVFVFNRMIDITIPEHVTKKEGYLHCVLVDSINKIEIGRTSIPLTPFSTHKSVHFSFKNKPGEDIEFNLDFGVLLLEYREESKDSDIRLDLSGITSLQTLKAKNQYSFILTNDLSLSESVKDVVIPYFKLYKDENEYLWDRISNYSRSAFFYWFSDSFFIPDFSQYHFTIPFNKSDILNIDMLGLFLCERDIDKKKVSKYNSFKLVARNENLFKKIKNVLE